MIRSCSRIVLVLASMLTAPSAQRLGVFPEALYGLQPKLDSVLRLDGDQAAKIASRSAPLRAELRELEEQVATAEPEHRAALTKKLATTRAELEPALARIAESVLDDAQKELVDRTRELHAAAVAAAATEVAARARKKKSADLESLVRARLLELCPGLDAAQQDRFESGLRAGLVATAREAANAAGEAKAATARSTEPNLLESIALGALRGLDGGSAGEKPKDVLQGLAEGAAKVATEKLLERLVDRLSKPKDKERR